MDTLSLGKHNPRLSDIRKALDHGRPTSDGLIPIEGLKLIREARTSGLEIAAVFARSDAPVEDIAEKGRTYILDTTAFRKIQSTETSQGVIALVRMPSFNLETLIKNPTGPIVILDQLQDPGNIGTILRCAESFGAAGCIGLTNTVSVYNPKAVRASAGSVFRIHHVWNVGFGEAAHALRSAGIPLVGTSSHSELTIAEWEWKKPVAVIIGNEGQGLDPDEARACDAVLRVPHRDAVESLNSAVAAGIILYEAFRQRGLR